ncbi:hypothetical protein AX769_20455 [Frondihabitans sp. PAMC 28766]|uniref:hypothetical protein n=1 Tax=Frondihabitans sp. PAMC 28766 TaxID=1795630 RepID=UPI00078C4A12|nr:hypothetical protein [Frondihabitans sp. PAMC 28766]AMM22082.1 hypothetical protein AX769_20455 [Frondihabitans sp. PAMC 28766]
MKRSTGAFIGGGAAAAAVVAALVVAGTAGPRFATSCPAVAKVITVDVHLSGTPGLAHDVRLCTSGGCSAPAASVLATANADRGPSVQQDSLPGGGTLPTAPTSAETPSPVLPTGGASFPAPTFDFFSRPPSSWTFDTAEEYPTAVVVAAYGADGHELASRAVDLSWHRPYPHDVCRAWLVTRPVTLAVAS